MLVRLNVQAAAPQGGAKVRAMRCPSVRSTPPNTGGTGAPPGRLLKKTTAALPPRGRRVRVPVPEAVALGVRVPVPEGVALGKRVTEPLADALADPVPDADCSGGGEGSGSQDDRVPDTTHDQSPLLVHSAALVGNRRYGQPMAVKQKQRVQWRAVSHQGR